MHSYSEVRAIVLNGVYSQGSEHRISAQEKTNVILLHGLWEKKLVWFVLAVTWNKVVH